MDSQDNKKLAVRLARLFVVMFIVACILGGYLTAYHYPIERDIDGTLDRCQVAGDAQRMADCLEKTIVSMEQYGITEGYNTVLFPTPADDVGLDYETLQDLQDRSKLVADMPIDSVEYQTALDDMRGTIREIDVGAVWWSRIRNVWFWLSLVLWCTVWIPGVAAIYVSIGSY